jgi:transcription termination factor Rho
MSIIDRAALEASPLADLHAIASELSIDGYRRLRKKQLIDAILARQEGTEAPEAEETPEAEPSAAAAGRSRAAVGRSRAGARRSGAGAGRSGAASQRSDAAAGETDAAGEESDAAGEGYDAAGEGYDAAGEGSDAASEGFDAASEGSDATAETEELVDAEELAEAIADELAEHDGGSTGRRRRRGRRGGRGRAARDEDRDGERDEEGEESPESEAAQAAAERDEDGAQEARGGPADEARGGSGEEARGGPGEDEVVDGIVELVGNGAGFVRANPPEPSDDDVYVSAAQVKRCELLSGDRITGPRRPPRRSERFASLVRIDTINGRPATEVADSTRFDDLPAAFAQEMLALRTDDATITAIEGLAPIGKGSRVTIAGGPRSGKTETLRRLAAALSGNDDLHLLVVLTGVRPEELPEWEEGPVKPDGGLNFAASADAQGQLVEPVIDQARRWAARGSDAVVLIDTLDGLHSHAARKAMASARNVVAGGSLTVIATASAPLGGETTVIALDALAAASGRFPALDVARTGTLRPERLVGEDGAEAIARMRSQALET